MVALLLAACGSDSSDSAGPDSEGSGGEQSTATEVTLRVAAPAVLSSLDSERYQGFVSVDVLPSVVGTLLKFERPEQGSVTMQAPDELEGELVESWEVSEDRSHVAMKLREGVLSNLGNTLDSEDVRWSIDRIINSEGVPIGRILAEMGGWDLENPVEVVDDLNFNINFTDYNAVSLAVSTTLFFAIYDSEAVQEGAGSDDPWGYNYLEGTTASFGPYQVDRFDPGVEVQLAANPNYHRGTPDVDRVIIRAVAEGSTRLQLIETAEADIAQALTFDHLTSLQGNPNVKLEQMLYPNIDVLVPNLTIEPFDDARVRQAMAYAIDREAILNSAYQGFGSVATDFFHEVFGVSEQQETLRRDTDLARSLLADAGYPNGFEMTVAYNLDNPGAHIEQVAVLLKDQLAEVGIQVTLQNMPSAAEFDAAKRDGTLQAFLATSPPLVPDPAYYVQVFYATGGTTNLQGYSNPEVDDLSSEILATQPGAERDALLAELSQLLFADMPSAPLIDTQRFYAFSPSVEGFRSYPQGNLPYSELSFG